MKSIVKNLIYMYRVIFSPDSGYFKFLTFGGCRYELSCSRYCEKALDKYDLLTAISLSLKRVISCHPLSKRPITDNL